VHRVQSKEEIKPAWFEGAARAAVIGGILVPSWSIEETAAYVRTLSS